MQFFYFFLLIVLKIRKISVISVKFAEIRLKSAIFRSKFSGISPGFQQIVDDCQKSIDFPVILENFQENC